MTYEETRTSVLTRVEAEQLVTRHGQTWAAFVEDHGHRGTYRGSVVLEWLGY